MASISISCPSCSATDGVVRNGKSTAGHQRYLCSHCRKTWQLQFTYTASQPGKPSLADVDSVSAAETNFSEASGPDNDFFLSGNDFMRAEEESQRVVESFRDSLGRKKGF